MVCRCSSYAEHMQREGQQHARNSQMAEERHAREMEELRSEVAAVTPNPTKYKILKVEAIERFLIIAATYPSCRNCNKLMVFEGVGLEDALMWERIDPHFDDKRQGTRESAPPPIARFPATDAGWAMARQLVGGLKPKQHYYNDGLGFG